MKLKDKLKDADKEEEGGGGNRKNDPCRNAAVRIKNCTDFVAESYSIPALSDFIMLSDSLFQGTGIRLLSFRISIFADSPLIYRQSAFLLRCYGLRESLIHQF